MHSHTPESEQTSAGEAMEVLTWNRQRTTEELTSFILGHHALLEDVDLGI